MLKAITLLPGIKQGTDDSAGFYVRGGSSHIVSKRYAEVHCSDLPDQVEYIYGGLLFTD